MFHIHKWNTLETFKFDNELNKFSGCRMDGFTAGDLAKRGIITVCQCEKCNKIKHIRTVFK
jgi:hypothetical protein